MVLWRVAGLLAERGWTVYRLMREPGLRQSVAYRVARPRQEARRVDGRTLDARCRTLGIGPGDL